MNHRLMKGFLPIAAGLLVALALSMEANAGSLHQGSTGSSGAVTGSLPGEVLWTDFAVGPQLFCIGTRCVEAQLGDSIIRLINPNGAANANLAGAKTQTVCAMIYVFDDDQEMGECCGCPVTSTQLATFSVEHNLTSDWSLDGGLEDGAHGNGAIAVVAAAPNAPLCLGKSAACNGGCDPTNVPGYSVTTASNLLGSRTLSGSIFHRTGVVELGLYDDAGGDPTNLVYLQEQCGSLVGNGTGGGICNCPTE